MQYDAIIFAQNRFFPVFTGVGLYRSDMGARQVERNRGSNVSNAKHNILRILSWVFSAVVYYEAD